MAYEAETCGLFYPAMYVVYACLEQKNIYTYNWITQRGYVIAKYSVLIFSISKGGGKHIREFLAMSWPLPVRERMNAPLH
jgi:hypothetical protein